MAEKDSKFEQLKGNAKETIGNAVGNEKMEKEGMQEKAAGKAKEYVEKGTDKANESIDNFSDKFKK
ncbi:MULTISPECIES: CsbD family protein [Jeotgalicoccus]|uniref:CsbD family protein n=1 Tax=Jeotgalicoccus TaxID=227979 RepID=UPI000409E805|nr:MULTISPECIES: CsbD family protein [Jeotgalicoccus]